MIWRGSRPWVTREGVELVEEGDPHREVGVGEQLDRLGLGAVGEQHRHVRLLGALDEQVGEGAAPLAAVADDDPGRVQAVPERPALAQELGAEDQVVGAEPLRPAPRVKPTGTVDFTTITALGLAAATSAATFSTVEVLK